MHWALRAAVLLGLATLVAPPAGADERRLIIVHRDALTVRLLNAPITEVLEEIGRQSGAEIRGTVRTPREISTEFADVPLPEALKRLLGDQDFALVYSHAGQLRAVKLLDGSDGSPPTPPPTRPAEVSKAELMRVVSGHDVVKVKGALAEAIGAPTARLVQIFDLATAHDDPTVRAEAVRTMVRVLETDQPVRSALMNQLHFMDDTAVSSFLRGRAGANAEDFVLSVLVEARTIELRTRASSILQSLRREP